MADTADVLLIADLARSQDVARALREAVAIDKSYGDRTDSILALGKLARANRAFAREYVDTLPPVAHGGFGEAPIVGALAEPAPPAALLAFLEQLPDAASDAPCAEADLAARRFLDHHYIAEDWRLSRNAVADGESETRAHYAWAKALARRFANRSHPMAEIARRLAIRAETSAIGADGQTIRREFAPDSPADERASTAAVRIEALARLAGLGFGEFRRPLEDAVAILRARIGNRPSRPIVTIRRQRLCSWALRLSRSSTILRPNGESARFGWRFLGRRLSIASPRRCAAARRFR